MSGRATFRKIERLAEIAGAFEEAFGPERFAEIARGWRRRLDEYEARQIAIDDACAEAVAVALSGDGPLIEATP